MQFVEARRADGGHPVNALRMTRVQWDQLQCTYQVGDLLMPCCDAAAIPKTSPNGYPFFAHASGACSTSEESQWHLASKQAVAGVLEQLGCKATIEEPGSGEAGRWQADVWSVRGNVKLAVEVQRSYQHLREYRRRQERYRAGGVRALWLLQEDRYKTLLGSMGKERFRTELGGVFPAAGHFGPCLADIPVARLAFDPDPAVSGAGFFKATLRQLLEAVLDGRFLCIDGLWCIDNLDAMRQAVTDYRKLNADGTKGTEVIK